MKRQIDLNEGWLSSGRVRFTDYEIILRVRLPKLFPNQIFIDTGLPSAHKPS